MPKFTCQGITQERRAERGAIQAGSLADRDSLRAATFGDEPHRRRRRMSTIVRQHGLREQPSMCIERDPVGRRNGSHIEHDPAIANMSKSIRSEVMRPLLRDDDEVRMCDAVAVDQIADTLEREHVPHLTADALRNKHDALSYVVSDIREMIDVGFGNHDTLARCGRLDGHERNHAVVLVDETGG
jgi:hypothetical protein